MKIRLGWVWYVYFLLYLSMVIAAALEFFRTEAAINFYYRFLIAFNTAFLIPYSLNLVSVIVNILSLFPFYSFITGTVLFTHQFSRWLLLVRIILDVSGRPYEFKTLKAISYHSRRVALIWLAISLILILPSYVAHFRYAFMKKSLRK